MTGGIYDHLLIVGTFCTFIQGMTNAYFTTHANVINRNSEKDFKRRSETDRCRGIGYPQKIVRAFISFVEGIRRSAERIKIKLFEPNFIFIRDFQKLGSALPRTRK